MDTSILEALVQALRDKRSVLKKEIISLNIKRPVFGGRLLTNMGLALTLGAWSGLVFPQGPGSPLARSSFPGSKVGRGLRNVP